MQRVTEEVTKQQSWSRRPSSPGGSRSTRVWPQHPVRHHLHLEEAGLGVFKAPRPGRVSVHTIILSKAPPSNRNGIWPIPAHVKTPRACSRVRGQC